MRLRTAVSPQLPRAPGGPLEGGPSVLVLVLLVARTPAGGGPSGSGCSESQCPQCGATVGFPQPRPHATGATGTSPVDHRRRVAWVMEGPGSAGTPSRPLPGADGPGPRPLAAAQARAGRSPPSRCVDQLGKDPAPGPLELRRPLPRVGAAGCGQPGPAMLMGLVAPEAPHVRTPDGGASRLRGECMPAREPRPSSRNLS